MFSRNWKGMCGEMLMGKNTTNLKTHLESYHKDKYRAFKEQELAETHKKKAKLDDIFSAKTLKTGTLVIVMLSKFTDWSMVAQWSLGH